MRERVAILLDGEWVKKTLRDKLGRFPDYSDVVGEVDRIKAHAQLENLTLFRVFYYTADPLTGTAINPLSDDRKDFGNTHVYSRNKQLLDKLENQPDFAVRRGELTLQGWKIGNAAMSALTSGGKPKTEVEADDLVPNIKQKGVDMRIGLDVASLALKRLVGTITLVSGDSDLVPAMKLARIEGLRVLLDTLGSKTVRPELKIHADQIL